MQNFFLFVYSKRTFAFLLILFGIVYISSFYHRFIQSDENWFGEEAYYLVKEGVVKLKSMPVVYSPDKEVFVIHKLFVYIGAAIIWLFGWSLWPLKIFIFCSFVLFLFIFNRWLKESRLNFNIHQRLLAIFFIITTPLMIEQTFIFRPEVLMMLFVFISFIFLQKGLNENNYASIAIGALFASMSFLTHLNGNAIVVAGFIYILTYKKFKSLLVYSLVAGLVCFLYFVDILSLVKLQAYFNELKNISFNVCAKDEYASNFFLFKLKGLLSEHQRFFWSERVYVVSVIFFISLFLGFKKFKAKYPGLLRYFLILLICGNLFGSFIAERYLIYYMPFMAIIISFTISNYMENKAKIIPYVFIFFMLAHILAVVLRFNFCFKSNYDHKKVHSEILSHIPLKSKVMAPWGIIYNGITDYNIVSYKNIEYYHNRILEECELHEVIEKLNVDYIIVSEQLDDYAKVDMEEIRKSGISSFKLIYSDAKYIILKN